MHQAWHEFLNKQVANKNSAENGLFLFDLADYGIIKIHGLDAKKLLQGQLTCDIESVTKQINQLTAHCNPQGRVISLFRIFQFHDAYYLVLPISMVNTALSALKKYAVFYKVELTDVTNHFILIGCTAEINHADFKNVFVTKIADEVNRFLLMGELTDIQTIWQQYFQHAQCKNSNAWKYLDMQNGIATIYPETSGKFLPHELNLQNLNAISFDKGCYTGQEIIARMHYRGKIKSHLYKAEIETTITPLPGADIYNHEFNVSGILVDIVQDKNNHYLSLILTDETNAKNKLFLNRDQTNYFTIQNIQEG